MIWVVAGFSIARRPMPAYAGYRSPVPGLYLTGAYMYPGGSVTSGLGDPRYFVRHFRRAHGATPRGWRRASRP